MPGRDYSVNQKTTSGRHLDRLGVEFIQAGFPITGEKDRESIRNLTDVCDAQIVGLARAVEGDVEAAAEANADVIEVIVPLSDLQLEHVLGKSRQEAFDITHSAVDLVRDHGATPHLALIDAFRTDHEHLQKAAEQFSDLEYLTLADTVGARTPHSVREMLAALSENMDLNRIGVHFHDDLGVATANTLTAYEMGVGKADVSIASLGERAGNAALEEVVVAGTVEHGTAFGTNQKDLVPVCEAVLEALDESDAANPRKAVLGHEVTEHESGLHTAAMLHEPSVFEPYDPTEFGGIRQLLFGAGTGRSGAETLLTRAGVEPKSNAIKVFLSRLDVDGPLTEDEAINLAKEMYNEEII